MNDKQQQWDRRRAVSSANAYGARGIGPWSRCRWALLGLALAGLALLTARATRADGYYFEEITTRGERLAASRFYQGNRAFLNNRGQVLCWEERYSGTSPVASFFLYEDHGKVTRLTGTLAKAFPVGFNDRGWIAGRYPTSSQDVFVDTRDGREWITYSSVSNDRWGMAINTRGQVVGTGYSGDAVLWSLEGPESISLGGGNAHAINDLEEVVGRSRFGKIAYHAFLWRDDNGNRESDEGEMRDLDTLVGGLESEANAISPTGEIVGWSNNTKGDRHACLWRTFAGQLLFGPDDLGTLWDPTPRWDPSELTYSGGAYCPESVGEAINDHGQVVGWSGPGWSDLSGRPVNHAFLYTDGVMLDLNLFVPPGSGWVLTNAVAINSAGQILCSGTRGTDPSLRFVLLSPMTTAEERKTELQFIDPAGRRVTNLTGRIGQTVKLEATLKTVKLEAALQRENSEEALSGKRVLFTVGTKVVGTGYTDGAGKATLLYSIPRSGGGKLITARFAGDPFYTGSSDTTTLAVAPELYLVKDLGVLPGYASTSARRISDEGVVIGTAYPYTAGQRAFRWTTEGIQDLGALGGRGSDAYAINASELVVGQISQDATDDGKRAVYWAGNWQRDVGVAPSALLGVNNLGIAVGWRKTSGTGKQAFVIDLIGGYPGGDFGGASSTAYDINDANQIVGSAVSPYGSTQAFVSTNGTLQWLIRDTKRESVGRAINASGKVLGDRATDAGRRAFVWGPTTGFQELAGRDHVDYFGQDINDHGIVVGSYSGSASPGGPFLWDEEGFRDLNDLPLATPGWNLTDAGGINNMGQIVGTGTIDGKPGHRAFLLEPATIDLTPPELETQIQVADTAGSIGQTVTLLAALTRAGSGYPLGRKPLTFSVGGIAVGIATTDTSGIAALDYTIPSSVNAGAQTISASFAGDLLYTPGTTDIPGTLRVIPPSPARPTYTITPINPPPSIDQGMATQAGRLNDNGVVAAFAYLPNSTHHAFRWIPGIGSELLLGIGTSWAKVSDIAYDGRIVGQREVTTGGRRQASLWTPGVGVTSIDVGASVTSSEAFGIGGQGWFVGEVRYDDGTRHAFIANGASPGDLGTFGGTNGWARDINDANDIVGGTDAGGGRAVLQRSGHGYIYVSPAEPGAEAQGVSSFTQVVGSSGGWGFLWDDVDGFQRIVPDSASAVDINDRSTVVGYFSPPNSPSSSSQSAFSWDPANRVRNLNDYIPSDLDWHLESATGINDLGQIAGWGTLNGIRRGFILTPNTAALTSLTLSPASVTGAVVTSSTATLTLSQPAPAGGVTVAIAVDPGLTAPPLVTIPEGNSSTTFNVGIATDTVTDDTPLLVSATLGTGAEMAVITVTP